LGVKGLVRDWLGVIAQVAVTAAPWVTAAVPRELRIDPCEKKSKGNEFARWRERAPTARWYHGHGVPISTYYSGNGGAKFAKKIWVVPEIRTNW
jgi:hypothetical protein